MSACSNWLCSISSLTCEAIHSGLLTPSALNLRQVGPIDTYDGWRGWADWVIDIVVEMVSTVAMNV